MFMSYVVFLVCCAYMYHASASWLRVSHVRQLLTVANFVMPRGVRSSRTPSSQTARLRGGHARSSPIGISSANSVPLGNVSLARRIRDSQTAEKARPSSASQLAEAEADSQNETTQGVADASVSLLREMVRAVAPSFVKTNRKRHGQTQVRTRR